MNIGELLLKGYQELKIENIDTYMIDCQLLLQKVLGKDRLFIITNRDMQVSETQAKNYMELIELRKTKMPIKYILGSCEFMGLEFLVEPGVLIPRPDTEILVEQLLTEISKLHQVKIWDVCTGSGAIGISIAKLSSNAEVVCSDISDKAIEICEKNINRLEVDSRVKILKSDLLQSALDSKEELDIVVSNPPYIKNDIIPTLMEDVKNFEPYIALSGGNDGLHFYRIITQQASLVLKKGGILAYEIGWDQKEAVKSIMESNNFISVKCIKDLAGKDRVMIANKA